MRPLAAAVGVALVLAVACGGASPFESEFERDPATGLAIDQEAAQERMTRCMTEAGFDWYDIGGSVQDHPQFSEPGFVESWERCVEASGTGWVKGNRPEEVAAANQEARDITECLRERGWEYPDPVLAEHGKYLVIADPNQILPEDEEERAEYLRDLELCHEIHAIDWEQWQRENPLFG